MTDTPTDKRSRNEPGLAREDISACLAYERDMLRAEKVYPSAAA